MSDILKDLADQIISKSANKSVQKSNVSHGTSRRVSTRVRPRSDFVKSQGPGGLIMDFGYWTGNPFADRATFYLNQFADPIQSEIVKSQRQSHAAALNDFVNLGEGEFKRQNSDIDMSGGVHSGWDKQLGKSLDDQVVEMVKKEGLGSGGNSKFVSGEFNKSTINVNGEKAVAQSETDAAVVEMFKKMGATLED